MMLSGDPVNGWPGLSTGVNGDKKSSTGSILSRKEGFRRGDAATAV